jgi:[ribosomal protein S18]-alanine N-acetyltransferase
MPDIIYKELDLRETARLMPLMEAAFDTGYHEAWSLAQIESLRLLPGAGILIALRDGEIIGFLVSQNIIDECEILLLAVASNCRRLGVGSSLIHTLSAIKIKLGVKSFFIEVRENNAALLFYKALGFEVMGVRHNYYVSDCISSVNAITMKKHYIA